MSHKVMSVALVTIAFFVFAIMIPHALSRTERAGAKYSTYSAPQEIRWEWQMRQTGVHDVQIPLYVRKEYARKHGLEEPWR